MSQKVLIFLVFLCLLLPSPATARTLLKIRPICGNYQIESRIPFKFNGNEKQMICGDPKVEAWKKIPESQAKFNIKNFLQDRGYFYPEFKKKDGIVTVYPEKITKIKKIILIGAHAETLKPKHRRRIKGAALTPANLSKLQKWAVSELNGHGYPCAKVDVSAEAYSGNALVKIETGEFQNFPPITDVPFKGLDPAALRRFDAFRTGKPFSQQLLDLTSRRIEEEGVVQNAYFTTMCTGDGLDITQSVSLGKPRLFVVGVGFNTEEYIKGKIIWKQTRLDKKGSNVQFKGVASYRIQKASAEMNYYPARKPTRWNLHPIASFERRFENKYEYIKQSTSFYFNTTWDNEDVRLYLDIGPQLSFVKTYKGANRKFTRFLSASTEFAVESHDFEFYNYDPRAGFYLDFIGNFSSKSALSEVNVQELQLTGQWLINIGKFDPPLFVLGFRGNASTTITNRNGPNFNNLPPDYLLYLGGQQDLRGFSRQELPRAYSGALTSAFTSAEFRLANFFPLGIQPLVFFDIGALGITSFNLDYPIYYSPGGGVRIYTFFGTVRLTYAHGFLIKNNDPANNPSSHHQIFVSYGQEF